MVDIYTCFNTGNIKSCNKFVCLVWCLVQLWNSIFWWRIISRCISEMLKFFSSIFWKYFHKIIFFSRKLQSTQPKSTGLHAVNHIHQIPNKLLYKMKFVLKFLHPKNSHFKINMKMCKNFPSSRAWWYNGWLFKNFQKCFSFLKPKSKRYWRLWLLLKMSPVTTVFHTVESVRLSLNSKGTNTPSQ